MSFTFANLPGLQVVTVDGGLASVNTPTNQAICVIGTSAIGPANSPYQVVSLATAAQLFGLDGTLIRGMSEAAAYCDNVMLMRVGTTQGVLTVGATSSGTEDFSGDATAATYTAAAGSVPALLNFTFPISDFPVDAVAGNTLTTSGFTPSGYNVTAAVIYSVDASTGVVSCVGPSSTPGAESVLGTGVVNVASNPGFTVTLGEVASTANTDYQLWYNAGLLSLWLNGNLVYSNDPNYNVNTGDSQVSGSAIGGQPLNASVSENPDTYANSISITAAIAVSVTSPDLIATYVAPQTGIGLTARQLYVAQQNAYNLLQGFPIDIVVTPGSLCNNANVAFYQSGTPSTAANNPVTNPNALGWLWTGVDVNGFPVYQWANEAIFWTYNNIAEASYTLQGQPSATTPTVHTFSDPTTRLAAGVGSANLQQTGFHEVSFEYQLARFCSSQSEAPQIDNGGCLGCIGTIGPANLSNFSLPAIQQWIGYLPVYNPVATTGIPTVPGNGLLGIPFLVGTTAGVLNDACADIATGRAPGMFETASGEYDGGPLIDANGYKTDIGAYLAVQGDYCLMSNGYGTYVGNIAQIVAGLISSLDQTEAVTNKQVAAVSQLYRASLNQLDSLTFADIDMLRYKGVGALPACLHDKTAATTASDYTLTLRQRIKFLMIETLLSEAENYIGNGTNDGLSLTALSTALTSDFLNLQKRGYISGYNFTITSTAAQQKIGQASIQVSFVPADELLQLNCTIGINLNS